MLKKVIILTIILMIAFQGLAFADYSSGSVILEDTLYGAVVGAVLGGAWYLLDQDDLGNKLSVGTGVGAFAGFALGVTDAFSVVEVEPNGDIKYAMPTIRLTSRNGADVIGANLLRVNF
jgi:hypothetical protein